MITSQEQQTLSESLARYCVVQMEVAHVETEIARITKAQRELSDIRKRLDALIAKVDGQAGYPAHAPVLGTADPKEGEER